MYIESLQSRIYNVLARSNVNLTFKHHSVQLHMRRVSHVLPYVFLQVEISAKSLVTNAAREWLPLVVSVHVER